MKISTIVELLDAKVLCGNDKVGNMITGALVEVTVTFGKAAGVKDVD